MSFDTFYKENVNKLSPVKTYNLPFNTFSPAHLLDLQKKITLLVYSIRLEGRFLSKLVYKFRPAKNLCTYQDIHIWGGQQQKFGAKCSKP